MPQETTTQDALAARVVALLRDHHLTVASAESLTGGGVAARLTSVPGSSAVYAGGVVAYATRVKLHLVGVPREVVEAHGVVSSECAVALAERVRTVVGADVGVATTGVAGPDLQEGRPVGTAFVAVADAARTAVRQLRVDGDRAAVRRGVVTAALELLAEVCTDATGSGGAAHGVGSGG